MNENTPDIIDRYFKAMEKCFSIGCQKVIFEPSSKKEWFFENDKWCYFEFYCDDSYYRLVSSEQKDFSAECIIKDMSYEIKMLLGFVRLRGVVTIEKQMFSDYVTKYEKEHSLTPDLTIEKFNFDLKQREEKELEKTDKIANRILTGCLGIIFILIIIFGLFALSVFFAPKAKAASKYSQEFIQNFYLCRAFSESKYNVAYNSNSTYEIKGYAPDCSGKCVYVETNRWQRGANVTTCYFNQKQIQEYYTAMINPDIKGSVLVKGMPVVGKNEEVVFLQYFNNPEVCITKTIR